MISHLFQLSLLLLLMMMMMMMMKAVPRFSVAAAWTIRQGNLRRMQCLGNLNNGNINNFNNNNWDSLLLLQTQQRSFHRMESRPNDYSKSQLKQSRSEDNESDDGNHFRNDFRGTRVFVQGIPPNILDWRLVKDHFKIAGEVVFASISIERNTGKSKGCGIVQYETTEMAQRAIQIMRNHPMGNGDQPLYVRPDYQESDKNTNHRDAATSSGSSRPKLRQSSRPRNVWRYCSDDNDADGQEPDFGEIEKLIQKRDEARRKKKYDASDEIRDELKQVYHVSMDDRFKLWWTSSTPPEEVMELKGEGRWKKKSLGEWRQIPTTPDQDVRVDAAKVEELLLQRDEARRRKDYNLADALLEQAKTSCGAGNKVQIHVQDDERSWRVWTEEKPHFASPREQCLNLIQKYEPNRMQQMESLLDRFPGREYIVLRKLKDKFQQSS